jgi:membrane-associated protease RseP (regulator of RpoE activity)
METEYTPEIAGQDTIAAQLREAVADVFEIQDVTYGARFGRLMFPSRQSQILRLRGRLLLASEEVYQRIAPRFEALEHTALLRRENDSDVIYALPGVVRPTESKRWVNVVLFGLTVLSVLFTGAMTFSFDAETLLESILYGLTHLPLGLPAAVALLAPLLVHEFGHYVAARRLGLPATLPYFIPLPILSPWGTMGAIIRMKGLMPNRRALLSVGVAGPLAGFVIAVPVLILGLALSPVVPFDPQTGVGILERGAQLEGNSLLYGGIKVLLFGQWLPGGGKDVFLHPIASSGWAALLVTALNLIPAGQLDGGHIAYALLGEKARWLTRAMLALTFIMGFFWEGWWLWAVLIWFFGRGHPAPLDDVTPLTNRQRVLAVIALILFVLTFIPIPMRIFYPPGG